MSTTKHVYALFDDRETAVAAYEEIQARGCSTEHCSAILHARHLDVSALPQGERASGEGAAKGALVAGSAGAAIAGLAVLGGGLVGVGPLALIVFGGGVMAAYGALVGGIGGSDEPDKHLRALERDIEDGKILVAVEVDDETIGQMCQEVFAAHGGRQVVF